MSVSCLTSLRDNDCCGASEINLKKRSSFIDLSTRFDLNKYTNGTRFGSSQKESRIQGISRIKSIYSTPNLTITNDLHRKTNSVQLYEPIYVARRSDNIKSELFYDQGDEFQLIKKMDEDYIRVIHLRTNTKCTMHRTRLRLDPDTPLRLTTDDRGVIQRCLLQYNVPGAYLIRRSKNQHNAFVLSVSQVLNPRNAEDWHYLIRINSSNYRFYFPQESRLENISFSSFKNLNL